MSKIQVVVRLRPMNDQETAEGTLPVLSATQDGIFVVKSSQRLTYRNFAAVFGSFSRQDEVFEAISVIPQVLQGYECCVFAYGQTGTGKTYTMEGILDDPEHHGIIPRSAKALFEALSDTKFYQDANVSCSFLELYNEELRDLLDDSPDKKLDLVSSSSGSVVCRNLSHQPVNSIDQVMQRLQQAHRQTGETAMNAHSSRSHAIFTLHVSCQRRLLDGSVLHTNGKLHLVDLAGSECAKTAQLSHSSASDQAAREQERRNINKSLLTLGRVMDSLQKGKTPTYRESKLTRILQQALGGNCRTVLIATLSPSILNIQESLQTLHYAQTACGIVNKPTSQSSLLLNTTTSSSASISPTTSQDYQDMEIRLAHYQSEVEQARQALAKDFLKIQELTQSLHEAKQNEMNLLVEAQKAKYQVEAVTQLLHVEKQTTQSLQTELDMAQVEWRKTTALLHATQETERTLSAQAKQLLVALRQSLEQGQALHQRVMQYHQDEETRRQHTKAFYGTLMEGVDSMRSGLTRVAVPKQEVADWMASHEAQYDEACKKANAVVSRLAHQVSDAVATVELGLSHELVPQAESMTTTVAAGVDETWTVLHEGEDELRTQFSEARHELTQSASRVQEFQTWQQECSQESLVSLREGLEKLEGMLQGMVDCATMALDRATRRSHETRGTLHNWIHQWQTAGTHATDHVLQLCSSQDEALTSSKGLMEWHVQRHAKVSQELLQQQEMLNNSRQSHVQYWQHQQEALHDQQERLEAAKMAQEMLSKQVLETVMAGVKTLVTQELDRITAEQATRTSELLQTNQQALQNHQGLCGLSGKLMDCVELTNVTLKQEAKALQILDDSLVKSVEEGKGAVQVIQKAATEFLKTQETCVQGVEETMGMLEHVESSVDEARTFLESRGQECLTVVREDAQETVKASISQLQELGTNMLTFQDEILAKMAKAVDKMEEPRGETLQQVSKALNAMNATTKEGASKISSITMKHLQVISDASTDVTESCEDFVSNQVYQTQAKESYQELGQLIDTHKASVEKEVNACHQELAKTRETTTKFSINVLHMTKTMGDAPELLTIDYSENLASTPETILSLKEVTTAPSDEMEVLQEMTQNNRKRSFFPSLLPKNKSPRMGNELSPSSAGIEN